MHFSGTVVRGKGEARTIGYPTANISYVSEIAPEAGVWTCQAIVDGSPHNSLAIIGMWTQANGLPSLEVHVLDVDRDFYDQTLGIELGTKLRDLVKFITVEELISQIKRDIVEAQTIFS